MTKTAQAVVIGGNTVTADVKHIENNPELNAVGGFIIEIDNTSGKYNGTFSVQDVVDIDIAGTNINNGWVDRVEPYLDDKPDTVTQMIRVHCRDYSRELTDLFIDKYFGEDPDTSSQYKADDIIEDALSSASSNITYTSPSAGTVMSYDAKDQYLLTLIRDVAERDGNDWFVDSTASPHPTLQYFARGSQSSGITLQTGQNSNILRVIRDQEEGEDLKNYILIRGKQVIDGWTEFNASDYGVPTDGTVSNDTSTATIGVASIKFVTGAATASWVELDFSGTLYGRTSVDLTNIVGGELKLRFRANTILGYTGVKVELTDTQGTPAVIESKILSLGDLADTWKTFSLPVGSDVDIARIAVLTENKWRFTAGTSFNWDIKKIRIYAPNAVTFWIDGLELPTKMFSIAQDATSQSNYGVRKLVLHKVDLESQVELDTLATTLLAQRKDPLTTIQVTCKGSAGISGFNNKWKPGHTVTVNIPEEGISSISYRMINIRMFWDDEETIDGHDFWVTVDLIKTTDIVDQKRLDTLKNDLAIMQELREYLRYQEQKEDELDVGYPALPGALEQYHLLSNRQWKQSWEVEKAPMSIDTSIDSIAAGTNTVSDTTASEGVAAKRLSSASTGRMFGSQEISPPGAATYAVGLSMKVADNSSDSTVLQFQVYRDDPAGQIITLNIRPSDCSTTEYKFFYKRGFMDEQSAYHLRGHFTTGITDVWVDWVGITDGPVAFGNTGIATVDGSDNDNPTPESDNDDPLPESDNDTAANNGSHTHGFTSINGQIVTATATRYAFTANSTASSLASFLAITPGTGLSASSGFLTGITSAGGHTHGMSNPSHYHGINSPTHDHGITSPLHDHGVNEGSKGHDH